MAGIVMLLVAIEATVYFKSTLPIVAYVFASLALTAWQSRSASPLRWYRMLRPHIVLKSVGVLAVVAAVALGLFALGNPILNWSWWNAVAAQSGDATGGGNIIAAPFSYPLLVPAFVALLILVLPRLAEMEELTFRRGTRTWRDGALRSLIFGLVHMVVGVPLAMGLALSIGGFWFTRQYFLGGVARSTLYHLCYNCIALGLVVLVVVVSQIAPGT